MPIFKRHTESREESNGSGENNSESKKQKGNWKKPANTAFKQQRLKAWQPILTPKTVLPALLIIGLIFAPIGGLLLWGNSTVSQITIPYTDCYKQSSTFSTVTNAEYRLRSSDANVPINPPKWLFDNSTGNNTCIIQFDVPATFQHPVFIYYKLTNFFQNHRRYVQSSNANQLQGKSVSNSALDTNCKPLSTTINGKQIYPCGLVANSLFNDTISNLTSLNGVNVTYEFTSKGIAWPGEKKKYTRMPAGNISNLVPPPNWQQRLPYPDGYPDESVVPDLSSDEHFQNWMRTAALPTFSKLWGRNDTTDLTNGTYNVTIQYNYPVAEFGGTKSIVISTIAWTGGKNAFLGWAYVGTSGLFVLLAILGTIRHLIKPRRLGDMNLLSWNQPGAAR